VADAPDPLGKRALFWAPAERHEAGPRRPGAKRIPPGRHALFSAAGTGTEAPVESPKKTSRPRPQLNGTPRPVRKARTPRPQSARPPRERTPATKVEVEVPEARGGGPINLSCSKCGTHTDVDILRYMVLHLPWWLWRPGRGYTSLMKCPACGQRAWVSASWQR
jgi:hypothetical protein